jgi:serine/threonine-protein kinase
MSARYIVEEQLAAGGMGVVYRVHDRSTGEACALKRIQPEVAHDPFHVTAFEREYQVLAGLDHPRIIRVFDYGVDEIGPFYTMELLEGEDMRRAAPIPLRDACLYLRDVATSLALLHARRLIHRDLSPSNVRMTPDGHCKLLDFGALASFGCSQHIVGTPPAIPPEALDGAPLDQRADLYALGALAYWMLTERHAYPAKQIDQLRALWEQPLVPPSVHVPGIPKALDTLLISLLSANPLGRPASAAEVIARLNVVGELAEEAGGEAQRLAESFLLSPRFVGRAAHLQAAKEQTESLMQGQGGALLLEATAGMGRTRFLEELGVRAQVAGAGVVRVDASMDRRPRGTTRALVLRTLDAIAPQAHQRPPRYVAALRALGHDIAVRLSATGSVPPRTSGAPALAEAEVDAPLEEWFAELAREKPLVVAVDNVDDADDASLGLIVALAKIAADAPLLLLVTERQRRSPLDVAGMNTLRGLCTQLGLSGLSPAETLELARGLFGDAPNVERFAEWLYGRTAGSPLYCIEISRQLVANEVVRYTGGMWLLPVDRPPDAGLPAALEDALSMRFASLSEPARALAECLSLQRGEPTLELCREVVDDKEGRKVLVLLDELACNDVLYVEQGGYRFSSVALREAVLFGMEDLRRELNHRRLGEAFAKIAGSDNPALRLEAGWHLIKGGDEIRGAEMIARVAHSSVTVRTLVANLHRAAEPIEAALKVFKRYRRSVYERMPLLAALSHAGYYQDRYWGDQYGDEALDACEDLSGVRTARVLSRFLGRWLGMVVGLYVAFVRFHFTPRRERGYPFFEMLVQLFGAVTTITGTAALSLDVERATRVADALSLFSALPRRLAPVGIYEFCLGLRDIGRDQQATAFTAFSALGKRFENPRQFRGLPPDARRLYVTGAHFARGAFAVYREDGRAALESADALDASGLKLYAMVASQLRFLYYANRGEFTKAIPHREQVELHAAHVGSAWQVETWEAASLIPVYTSLSDIVMMTRTADRLDTLSATIPSLRFYSRLSRFSLDLVRGHWDDVALRVEMDRRAPRSFIGWAAVIGFHARGYNEQGNYAVAKSLCEDALKLVTDADREYVTLFMWLDIQLAIADAGLGEIDKGLARIDGLLDRFRNSDHPLVQGFLHEARARICWMAGRVDEYDRSVATVERWFRPTGTPALIAKWERLADLKGGASAGRGTFPSLGSLESLESIGQDPSTATESARLATVSEPDARTVRAVLRRSGSDAG